MKNKSTQVLYHHGGLDLFGVSRKPKVFFLKRAGAMAERHAPTFWRRTGRATKGQQPLMLGVLFVAGPCAAECT